MRKSLHTNAVGSLGPLLCWGVVFADIGSSVYYVPGLLFDQPGIGPLAATFVLLVALACVALAVKYAEIASRYSSGGGVVSVASDAFGPYVGCLGGILITTDYFLTAAIGALSGILCLTSVAGGRELALPLACVALALLGLLNVIGIRVSAIVTLVMALCGFATQLVLVLVAAAGSSASDWAMMRAELRPIGALGGRQLLVGFGAAWLAFSGLESLSQLSPKLSAPRRRVALMTMALVFGSMLATAPLLTAFSTTILLRHAAVTHSDAFIWELAGTFGGTAVKVAVVLSAAALLVFSANTAILGCYHVFTALVRKGFMPAAVARPNRAFGTPHYAIAIATGAPIVILIGTLGNVEVLGQLYAFGLLGAFVLSSAGLDVIRWLERRRGISFWLGAATTLAVFVAWLANLYGKPGAARFGVAVTTVGMLLALATKRQWLRPAFADTSGFWLRSSGLRLHRLARGLIEGYYRWTTLPRRDVAELWARLGRRRKGDAALIACRRAVELAPDDLDTWMLLASLCFESGRIEESMDALHSVLQRRPKQADAHFLLGRCLTRLNRHDEALACFDKAAELAPEHARAHHQRGVLLHRAGNLAGAIAALEKAVALSPQYALFQRHLGLALESAGRQKEAAHALAAASMLEGEPEDDLV